jgi:hypothetical protein
MLAKAMNDPSVGAVLIHDYSRFSRDSTRGREAFRALIEHGIRVISVTEPEIDLSTDAGFWMEAITFAKNESESRANAFRTLRGCLGNIKNRDPKTGWVYRNGGQPMFGYRSHRFEVGRGKCDTPLFKCIHILDERVVAGRALYDWARHLLVNLGGQGASYDAMALFMNESGVHAPRKRYWAESTIRELFTLDKLLKATGLGIYNMKTKKNKPKPPDQWVIEEKASPAIITEEEAAHIWEVRQDVKKARTFYDPGYGSSRRSKYLLSGGPFKCTRCGANMTGYRSKDRLYYVCGSLPYRKGMGCGPGLYVPKEEIEGVVLGDVNRILACCTEQQGFVRLVNEELRGIWQQMTGHNPAAARLIKEIDKKIANIRRNIEEGLNDAAWANSRMAELVAERAGLIEQAQSVGEPPRVDAATALTYRKELEKATASADPGEIKRVLRLMIDQIKLAPEDLSVEITYMLPEPVLKGAIAGPRFELGTFGL